jgi:predicted DNA-binding protein (MmcQ/YjbR family)
MKPPPARGLDPQRRLAAADLDSLIRRSHALVAVQLTRKLRSELGLP